MRLKLTLALTAFSVAVSGYHPFVEDGGVYAAGIRKLLDPSLYPTWTPFVTEHLRFSLFAPMVAALVRATHLPLEWVLFLLFLATTWATLLAGWMLAARIAPGPRARAGAVCLLACWLTLPIAGTSLLLMDPYVTARSFTTPLVLMALAWALDRSWLRCAAALIVAAALHPLMAGYGGAAIAMLACLRSPHRRWAVAAIGLIAFAAAAAVQALAPPESLDYVRVALTRYYWFPFDWQWYEWIGLVAPLALIAWLRLLRAGPWKDLAETGLRVGILAALIALLFAQESYPTHLVARLQPLREFQIVYILMILLLGAQLGEQFGERVLQNRAWRWATLLAIFGSAMFWAQRETFPNSGHIEWPWAAPVNPWSQAFVWIRQNTPKNALFALDSHYITEGKHEDAQCFRAISARSALPDYSKDGGEASITPSLTAAWVDGQLAQADLETETDAQRLAKLRPLAVTWVVLQRSSPTAWLCPYTNATVKVCRLP